MTLGSRQAHSAERICPGPGISGSGVGPFSCRSGRWKPSAAHASKPQGPQLPRIRWPGQGRIALWACCGHSFTHAEVGEGSSRLESRGCLEP
eukprot:15468002-Alexandrium_andersonii.AAC.1